jgi:hypothetical protein
VFTVYVTVLASIWQPQGLFLLCDRLLHYITPALCLLTWLLVWRDGSLSWRDIGWWTVYPILYLVYALARAPIAGEVPYPFLDVAQNGVGGVVVAALMITALFLAYGVVLVLLDRRAAASAMAAPPR